MNFIKIKNRIKEKILSIGLPNNFFYFSQKGYCPCCDKIVVFRAADSWLRDHFACCNCNSIPRERALMVTIEEYFPNWKELNIHESSPENRGTSLKLKKFCEGYVATQYYPGEPKGTLLNGMRNEDLENQTFDSEFFDLIITQDVMEHVYDPERAFKEIARTLKKGGAHIFTVPIVNKHNPSENWAIKGADNNPIFIKTPEYHGNPVDPNGSPVTMHWGYDIVSFVKEHSGLNTKIVTLDNLNMGIRAEFIEVLVSIK